MFSTKEKLQNRTGEHGINRFSYLTQLVEEYNATHSQSAKEQVLANLANFAYDPINYKFFQRLKVLDVFLSELTSNNKRIVRFAIGGICNICLEPFSKQYILRNNGIQLITNLIFSSDESTALSAMTTLMFILDPNNVSNALSNKIKQRLKKLSEDNNVRFRNLAQLLIEELDL